HDYSILQDRKPEYGAANGYYPGGRGRYVKYFTPDEKAGHIFLDIDGAYMCSEISVNDQLMAIHPNGYAPFLLDITDKIQYGRINKISVVTDAHQPSTRWYSGAGIYRDVFLWTGGDVRVEPRDVFITTPDISAGKASVDIRYAVSSDIDGEAEILSEILYGGEIASSKSAKISVSSTDKTSTRVTLDVVSPKLWDVDDPCLYTLRTTIYAGGKVTDEIETVFGIRKIECDAENGLRLNGREIKLRGGCLHHDHGVLGAASYPAAEERRLRKLKDAGFNAIRTSHYPPSTALLEVCDRIGLIVMDEAFDMWIEGKTTYDYHLWFADWWQRDIAAMVLRDRNHPCVISYSIGNEVNERAGKNDGAAWAEKLTGEIRRNDPTRLVTMAVCGVWDQPESIDPEGYREIWKEGCLENGNSSAGWADRTAPLIKYLDIAGYNYLWRRYASDSERFPDRVIWGSETFAIEFWDSWNAVISRKNIIGDFVWTAYDYLGEAGIGRGWWERDKADNGTDYPWRMSFDSDFDIAGYRRPQSYFRERIWKSGLEPKIFTTHPEHWGEKWSGTSWHWYDVLDTWTFDDRYEGRPVRCDCYTDADYVIWTLNGKIVGRSEQIKGMASYDIPYRKGTLEAAAYKNGVLAGRTALKTVGAPAWINVTPEKSSFKADGRDLLFADVDITDKDGNHVPDAKTALRCVVTGGDLVGIFSGDPRNEDKYGTNECHAFTGRATAVIKAKKTGAVTILVTGEGVASGFAEAKAE
nr:DUF4982 domain-containing protein [Clostridiales bacterium]